MRNALRRIDGRLILLRIVAPACLLTIVMVGIGLLITRVLAHDWPFTAEDGVDRTLAAHRTHLGNDVSGVFSTGASTAWAIGLAVVAIVGARLYFRRWREAAFIAVTMLVEVSVFLTTTLIVHRARPGVPELDISPPTSSYPSGHTAAALALYGSVAVLVYLHSRRRSAWLLLLIPAAVGASRLYRGMHHPSDVVAGLLLGLFALLIAKRAILVGDAGERARATTAARDRDRDRGRGRNRPRVFGAAR